MDFPLNFISATREYADFDRPVPAPYLRRSFTLGGQAQEALLTITGLGFYRVFVNGEEITKGILAPYISNPDDIIYYDQYDVADRLRPGENVIGVILGNGMLNCFGGYIWDFEKARYRAAPMTALRLEGATAAGESFSLESDTSFKTHPSPILFNELRCGEYYDARLELPGWAAPGFDDSGWADALPVTPPRGEPRLCEAEPIVASAALKAVSITPYKEGYLYDFGLNTAGRCRLKINGTPGQEIYTSHCELYRDGVLEQGNINFGERGDPRCKAVQCNRYLCRGEGEETYAPAFAYYGFQYVYVTGITPEQATPELLTYEVMHSDLKERGSFSCSDGVANKLQECTRRSDLANFYYFPTDCPHREKNGWTGDAALSAEHMLLNLNPETSYREWLRNIAAAMDKRGALPGIVPTGGWGFNWGNGPAWDCVLTYLPYFTYIYRGDREIVEENATPIFRYLNYLTTRRDQRGLIAIGLGDWCPAGRGASNYKVSLEFTDTVISMDIARKAAYLFGELGMGLQQKFAAELADSLREAVRKNLVDFGAMTADNACQTAQAMAIFYDVFEAGEKPAAFARLKELIADQDDHLDVGILGVRVLFHVLSDFGEADLAFKMITRKDFPSYGYWVDHGATSLWETFERFETFSNSLNHHFLGDISSWFIQAVAGIRLNPNRTGCDELLVAPNFISALDHAEASHAAPAGKISVKWARQGETVLLSVSVPEGMTGYIRAPKGWLLPNALGRIPLASGEYVCTPIPRRA